MTPHRRRQQSFGDGLIREEVSDLWEPWMRHADQIMEDDSLVEIVQAALSKRCQKSKTRGRPGHQNQAAVQVRGQLCRLGVAHCSRPRKSMVSPAIAGKGRLILRRPEHRFHLSARIDWGTAIRESVDSE